MKPIGNWETIPPEPESEHTKNIGVGDEPQTVVGVAVQFRLTLSSVLSDTKISKY